MALYQSTYTRLMQHSYYGVRGVVEASSGVAGPTAALLACTHGNEPAGLGAIEYILSDLQLIRGRLLCVIVNNEAAERHFKASDITAREKARYIDYNMNRIPDDFSDWEGSSEGTRLAELLPILQEIDGGVLDLHSTSADAPQMLITVDEGGCKIAKQPTLPFTNIISNITPFLSGRFLIEACPSARIKLLAECGQHDCPQASSRAIDISLAFLHQLGMIEAPTMPTTTKDCYRVKQALHVPTSESSYHLIAPIAPFAWIEEGQAIASNGSHELLAPQSGYAIMCPQTQSALCSREALLFLCDKETIA